MTRKGLGTIILAAFLLASCAGTPQTRATTGLAVACVGYASSLRALALMRSAGRLSAAQIATVDRVRVVVSPACLNEPPDNVDAVLAIVERGAYTLLLMKREN